MPLGWSSFRRQAATPQVWQIWSGNLRAVCRGRIAHFKVPRYVVLVDEFPMTVTGKVQKYLLRQQMVERLGLTEAD